MSPSDKGSLELEEHSVGERSGSLSPSEAAYVDALQKERKAFLGDESADAFLSRPAFASLGVPPRERTPRRWWLGAAALASAAVLLVALQVREPTGDEIQLRGGGLTLIVARGDSQLRLDEDVELRPGDKVRFQVTVRQPGEIEVGFLANDGRYETLVSEHVSSPGLRVLSDAVEIDDSAMAGEILAGSSGAVRKAVEDRGASSGELGSVRVRTELP
ncbi:MAG: hypothetical protein AAFQ82_20575 [Myxococcota bacterium]